MVYCNSIELLDRIKEFDFKVIKRANPAFFNKDIFNKVVENYWPCTSVFVLYHLFEWINPNTIDLGILYNIEIIAIEKELSSIRISGLDLSVWAIADFECKRYIPPRQYQEYHRICFNLFIYHDFFKDHRSKFLSIMEFILKPTL